MGCGKITADDDIYFGGIDDASVEYYYDMIVDGNEYFIAKSRLEEVIPLENVYCHVGLRVDKRGNAYPIEADDILEGETTIDCLNQHGKDNEDGTDYNIYIDGPRVVEKVKGYRIFQDGETYDITKADAVEAANDAHIKLFSEEGFLSFQKQIEFESNPNGGKDIVKAR